MMEIDFLTDEDYELLAEELERGVPQDLSWFYELVQVDGWEQVQFR